MVCTTYAPNIRLVLATARRMGVVAMVVVRGKGQSWTRLLVHPAFSRGLKAEFKVRVWTHVPFNRPRLSREQSRVTLL